MPELPEVETSVRGIRPHCVGQMIKSVIVRQARLRWPVAAELPEKLENKIIISVTRRGKYLLLNVDDGALMIHLGMSGSLRVIDGEQPIGKHDHIDITLGNQKTIRFNDPRRFGSFIFNDEGLTHSLLNRLGPEPLTDDFNADYLYGLCRRRKVAIKPLIMNSQIVVGVGNIYAQEALFRASIHPATVTSRIAKVRLARLVTAIKKVLSEAIASGGSSLKDFTSAEGKPGYFQHTFRVYGRAGEPCVNCDRPLKQTELGQRTTVYCGYCQR